MGVCSRCKQNSHFTIKDAQQICGRCGATTTTIAILQTEDFKGIKIQKRYISEKREKRQSESKSSVKHIDENWGLYLEAFQRALRESVRQVKVKLGLDESFEEKAKYYWFEYLKVFQEKRFPLVGFFTENSFSQRKSNSNEVIEQRSKYNMKQCLTKRNFETQQKQIAHKQIFEEFLNGDGVDDCQEEEPDYGINQNVKTTPNERETENKIEIYDNKSKRKSSNNEVMLKQILKVNTDIDNYFAISQDSERLFFEESNGQLLTDTTEINQNGSANSNILTKKRKFKVRKENVEIGSFNGQDYLKLIIKKDKESLINQYAGFRTFYAKVLYFDEDNKNLLKRIKKIKESSYLFSISKQFMIQQLEKRKLGHLKNLSKSDVFIIIWIFDWILFINDQSDQESKTRDDGLQWMVEYLQQQIKFSFSQLQKFQSIPKIQEETIKREESLITIIRLLLKDLQECLQINASIFSIEQQAFLSFNQQKSIISQKIEKILPLEYNLIPTIIYLSLQSNGQTSSPQEIHLWIRQDLFQYSSGIKSFLQIQNPKFFTLTPPSIPTSSFIRINARQFLRMTDHIVKINQSRLFKESFKIINDFDLPLSWACMIYIMASKINREIRKTQKESEKSMSQYQEQEQEKSKKLEENEDMLFGKEFESDLIVIGCFLVLVKMIYGLSDEMFACLLNESILEEGRKELSEQQFKLLQTIMIYLKRTQFKATHQFYINSPSLKYVMEHIQRCLNNRSMIQINDTTNFLDLISLDQTKIESILNAQTKKIIDQKVENLKNTCNSNDLSIQLNFFNKINQFIPQIINKSAKKGNHSKSILKVNQEALGQKKKSEFSGCFEVDLEYTASQVIGKGKTIIPPSFDYQMHKNYTSDLQYLPQELKFLVDKLSIYSGEETTTILKYLQKVESKIYSLQLKNTKNINNSNTPL